MKDNNKRDRRWLEQFREYQRLLRAVAEGQNVPCPVCGKKLRLVLPGEGIHPGVYCETGCTEILIDFGRVVPRDPQS